MRPRPAIERDVPDQHGTPGFFLYLPMVEVEAFAEELTALVPATDRAWSVSPPAYWIAERHLDRVRALVAAFFGAPAEAHVA